MTKWALNKQKGSIINHPSVGKLIGGIAREVTDKDAVSLKGIINIIIFDGVESLKKED